MSRFGRFCKFVLLVMQKNNSGCYAGEFPDSFNFKHNKDFNKMC